MVIKREGGSPHRGLKKITVVLMAVVVAFLPIKAIASQTSGWTTSGTRSLLIQPDVPVIVNETSWQDYNPEEIYPDTITLPRQYITMEDGTRLAAYITLPAGENGVPVEEPLPTLLVISDYNVTLANLIGPPLGIFMGAADPYIVKRGYTSISIDGRGTGNSEGTWDAWASSQGDYEQIINWVVQQPWTNGSIGIRGVSDLAINGLFAAQTGHPAIKAVFAVAPIADTYRDTVGPSGSTNLYFMSIWLGLTTMMNTLNPELLNDPEQALPLLFDHLWDAVTQFQAPLVIRGLLGDPEVDKDGPFWALRSPIERADDIMAPTFLVSSVHDIFQRGVPAFYEQLKNRVNTKMVILPGTHIEGAFSTTGPEGVKGLPPFNHIELQWFDHYLKGVENGADRLPNVTQYMIGLDQMAVTSDWPAPEAEALRYYMHSNGTLKTKRQSFFGLPRILLDVWFDGTCSESLSTWSLGILGFIPMPCFETNNKAETFNLIYETPAFESDFVINGPIQADVWVSTTGISGTLSVRVDDLDPEGNAIPLTNGMIHLKDRRVDETRSRTLDDQSIQPWHPFTKDAEKTVFPNVPMKVSVEIFTTSAVLKPGHKLRVAIGPSNVPMGVATGSDALLELVPGLITVYSDYWHPSSIVVPVVPADSFIALPLSQQ